MDSTLMFSNLMMFVNMDLELFLVIAQWCIAAWVAFTTPLPVSFNSTEQAYILAPGSWPVDLAGQLLAPSTQQSQPITWSILALMFLDLFWRLLRTAFVLTCAPIYGVLRPGVFRFVRSFRGLLCWSLTTFGAFLIGGLGEILKRDPDDDPQSSALEPAKSPALAPTTASHSQTPLSDKTPTFILPSTPSSPVSAPLASAQNPRGDAALSPKTPSQQTSDRQPTTPKTAIKAVESTVSTPATGSQKADDTSGAAIESSTPSTQVSAPADGPESSPGSEPQTPETESPKPSSKQSPAPKTANNTVEPNVKKATTGSPKAEDKTPGEPNIGTQSYPSFDAAAIIRAAGHSNKPSISSDIKEVQASSNISADGAALISPPAPARVPCDRCALFEEEEDIELLEEGQACPRCDSFAATPAAEVDEATSSQLEQEQPLPSPSKDLPAPEPSPAKAKTPCPTCVQFDGDADPVLLEEGETCPTCAYFWDAFDNNALSLPDGQLQQQGREDPARVNSGTVSTSVTEATSNGEEQTSETSDAAEKEDLPLPSQAITDMLLTVTKLEQAAEEYVEADEAVLASLTGALLGMRMHVKNKLRDLIRPKPWAPYLEPFDIDFGEQAELSLEEAENDPWAAANLVKETRDALVASHDLLGSWNEAVQQTDKVGDSSSASDSSGEKKSSGSDKPECSKTVSLAPAEKRKREVEREEEPEEEEDGEGEDEDEEGEESEEDEEKNEEENEEESEEENEEEDEEEEEEDGDEEDDGEEEEESGEEEEESGDEGTGEEEDEGVDEEEDGEGGEDEDDKADEEEQGQKVEVVQQNLEEGRVRVHQAVKKSKKLLAKQIPAGMNQKQFDLEFKGASSWHQDWKVTFGHAPVDDKHDTVSFFVRVARDDPGAEMVQSIRNEYGIRAYFQLHSKQSVLAPRLIAWSDGTKAGDAFIVEEYVRGTTLGKAWVGFTDDRKVQVLKGLAVAIADVSCRRFNTIGSVYGSPARAPKGCLLIRGPQPVSYSEKGPFEADDDLVGLAESEVLFHWTDMAELTGLEQLNKILKALIESLASHHRKEAGLGFRIIELWPITAWDVLIDSDRDIRALLGWEKASIL